MNERVLDGTVRQWIYRRLAADGVAPLPGEIARAHDLTPIETRQVLRRLADEHHAIVLLPGSDLVWMAQPFSGVPTDHRVTAGSSAWWANCVWDALAVLALLQRDGSIQTSCPLTAAPVEMQVVDGVVHAGEVVAHFAVPAARWHEDIGFT